MGPTNSPPRRARAGLSAAGQSCTGSKPVREGAESAAKSPMPGIFSSAPALLVGSTRAGARTCTEAAPFAEAPCAQSHAVGLTEVPRSWRHRCGLWGPPRRVPLRVKACDGPNAPLNLAAKLASGDRLARHGAMIPAGLVWMLVERRRR